MPARLRLFEKPEETPPGLDAIRAWLQKPRPRLRGAWIWIRWILSGIPAAYKYLAKKAPAARERMRRIASQGEKVARGAVWVGHAARDLGGAVVRTTRAFRGPDGKVSGATARVREMGRAVRSFGGRVTEGGGGVAAAFSSLGRLVRNDRGETANGLGLLDPPREPDREASKAPPRRLPGPLQPSPPAPAPAQEESLPQAAPGKNSGPGPEPGPEPRPSETQSQPPAAAAPEDDREARFEGLPKVFLPRANAVGDRPHPEALRALILDICRHRDWTTPAQMARWFSMHRRGLANRHLRPLLEAGLLERRYPHRPNTPKQAYRTRRESTQAAGSGATWTAPSDP